MALFTNLAHLLVTLERGSLDVLTFDQRPKLALTTYLGFVTTLKAIDVNKRTAADN